MNELVECRSGHSYAVRPIALTWQGKRLRVQEILSEWRTPLGKHFKLIAEDEQVFELIFVEESAQWEIHGPSAEA